MKNIVNKEGDVIAKTTDDGTLIGGHHRLSVAASIGQQSWSRLSEQSFRVDRWSLCRG